jgi:hypothetical protein
MSFPSYVQVRMPPRALQDAKDTTPDAQDAFCKNQGKGQIHPIRPIHPRIGQRFIQSAMAVADKRRQMNVR